MLASIGQGHDHSSTGREPHEGDHACDYVRHQGLPHHLRHGQGHAPFPGETPTDHGLQIPGHETVVELPVELIRKAIADGLI